MADTHTHSHSNIVCYPTDQNTPELKKTSEKLWNNNFLWGKNRKLNISRSIWIYKNLTKSEKICHFCFYWERIEKETEKDSSIAKNTKYVWLLSQRLLSDWMIRSSVFWDKERWTRVWVTDWKARETHGHGRYWWDAHHSSIHNTNAASHYKLILMVFILYIVTLYVFLLLCNHHSNTMWHAVTHSWSSQYTESKHRRLQDSSPHNHNKPTTKTSRVRTKKIREISGGRVEGKQNK